jgi:hypothetical protein
MADEPQANPPTVLRAINWREVFPFTNIFRSFRVAVHPSKLVLGLLALLMLYLGGRILDAVWPQKYQANYGEASGYGRQDDERPYQSRIEAERAANQARYASILTALDARDKALKEAATRRDEAVKAAGTDAAKTQAASKAYDAEVGQAIRGVDAAMSAASGGRERRGGELPAPGAGATEAAKTFANAGDTKHRLVLSRDLALELNQRAYESDVNAANTVADATLKDQQLRDARDRRNAGEAAAFDMGRRYQETIQQILPRGLFAEFFDYEVSQINHIANSVYAMNWGKSGVVGGVINFFCVGPAWLFRFHTLYAVLFFVLFLVVWAVFGGAIARIAAVQVARDEKISVRQALRFSINKVLSFVFAPIIPLIIILIIGLLLAVGGLLFYIPWIGPIVAGGLFFLALIAGVVITLVLIGTAGGLNLMFPTIAVEGSDSFDAISRSFSYVFARPWRMLWYTFVAIIYGGLTYLFVRFFVFLVLASTHFFVGWWLGGQPGRWFPEIWPMSSLDHLPYDVNFAGLAFTEKVAAFLISFWVYMLIGLMGAFVISFYFSANTIIYYLMRREVDATELEDVYVEDAEDDLIEPPAAPAPAAAIPSTMAPAGAMGAAGSTPATVAGTVSDLPIVPPTGEQQPPPGEQPPPGGNPG